MERRVSSLETKVAVLDQRQDTAETELLSSREAVVKIHDRMNSIDRRLSKMQGQMIAALAAVQILVELISSKM
jgi:uncharacterized coiled-coil protein SlyX